MNKTKALLVVVCLALTLSSCVARLPTYNIDAKNIKTGGLSSGGYMAVQVHIAFSKTIKGSAIVAGGPFWCAQGNLGYAMSNCMSSPNLINLDTLNKQIKTLVASGEIDNTTNLQGSKAFVFSGTLDDVVVPGVVNSLITQYKSFGVDVTSVLNVPAEHAYITDNYGNKCAFKGTPYINNCSYDLSSASLTVLYGDLNAKVSAVSQNLIEFDQTPYIEAGFSMQDKGYIYVPTACKLGAQCKLFVEFHGCKQTLNDVGTEYVKYTGLNEVAEANQIIVLYPQAKASSSKPVNPNGCWDWFAYTGDFVNTTSYVTKAGKQMNAIWKMVTDLVGTNPELLQDLPSANFKFAATQ